MTQRIKVLLCDDHTLFREGLKSLIDGRPGLEVVGEARDGKEAIEKTRQLHPDVVLLDVSMPGLNGFEAARRIVRLNHKTKVLILSMYDEDDLIIRCLEAGASGYVLKDAPVDQLIYAIEETWKGGKYLSPAILSKVVNQYLKTAVRPTDTYDLLSPREREILKLLAEGYTVKEVAFQLKLSTKTAEAHKYNLMRKIGIHDLTGLVKYALKKRLIRVTPADK